MTVTQRKLFWHRQSNVFDHDSNECVSVDCLQLPLIEGDEQKSFSLT